MKTIHLLLVFCFFCFTACQNKHNEFKLIELSNNLEDTKNSEIINQIDFLHLEETDSSIISNIERIGRYKDIWYIFDNKQQKIISFDNYGKYLTCYDKIGQGKGEYIEINSFDIDLTNGHIYLLCPQKIIILDKNLSLKDEIPLKQYYWRIAYFEKGVFLLSLNDTYIDYMSFDDLSIRRIITINEDKYDIPGHEPYFIKSDEKLFFHIESVDKLLELSIDSVKSIITFDYDNKEESNTFFSKNTIDALDIETRFKYARPNIQCVICKNNEIESFVYSRNIYGICIKTSEAYKNYILKIPCKKSMCNYNDTIVTWIYANEYSPEAFNHNNLYDDVIVNHLDGNSIKKSENPILVLCKLVKS